MQLKLYWVSFFMTKYYLHKFNKNLFSLSLFFSLPEYSLTNWLWEQGPSIFKNNAYSSMTCHIKKKLILLMKDMLTESFREAWLGDLFIGSQPHRWFSSVQFIRSVASDSLGPHESQHARPHCPSSTPRVHSDSCPSSQWCIQPSHPMSSPSPPAPNPSQHQGLFQWVNSLHEVAKVLEFQL